MSRWVRISCDILDSPVFKPEPFTEREAWMWLIMHAAWKETRHRLGNEVMPVERGSLFVTLRELQSAWRWKSDFRVRSFLDTLEKEAMIERKNNAGKTHVTICNYDKYQSRDNQEQRTENASATQAQRKENALKIPRYQDTKEDNSFHSLSGVDISPENPPIEKPKKQQKEKRSVKTQMAERWPDGPEAYNVFEEMVKAGDASWDDFDRIMAEFGDYNLREANSYASWPAALRTWIRNDRKFKAERERRSNQKQLFTRQ